MEVIGSTVSKVFIASRLFNIGQAVREAIKSAGSITVRELQLGPDGTLSPECAQEIPEIEFLFADPQVVGQILSHHECRVKWIQNSFAGVERAFKAINKLEKIPDVILTRQSDGFGQYMGEYVIAQIVSRERNFPYMIELQKQNKFEQSNLLVYRSLGDLSLGIIGLGTIGQEVARQCKAMNMTVWGAVRDARFNSGQVICEHVHHVRPMSRLSELLQECDYVVSIVPSTPESRGLLSGSVLKACENKKSVLISMGRGDVIDDESLINALKSGWLGGAILDVFNQEPLPPDSPLWNIPGVTITPHVSGATSIQKAVKTFVDNIIRYQKGEPLLNRVDLTKGY